jgi:hypothetical protein
MRRRITTNKSKPKSEASRVIQHRVLKEQRCIFVEVRQSPSVADLKAAAKLMVRDPDYRRELNRLCDLSQANLSHFTITELVDFVDFSKENIPMSANARVAVVVPDTERAGIIRSYADLIDRGNFKIFTNPINARKWVQERPGSFKEDGTFCKVLGGVA